MLVPSALRPGGLHSAAEQAGRPGAGRTNKESDHPSFKWNACAENQRQLKNTSEALGDMVTNKEHRTDRYEPVRTACSQTFTEQSDVKEKASEPRAVHASQKHWTSLLKGILGDLDVETVLGVEDSSVRMCICPKCVCKYAVSFKLPGGFIWEGQADAKLRVRNKIFGTEITEQVSSPYRY